MIVERCALVTDTLAYVATTWRPRLSAFLEDLFLFSRVSTKARLACSLVEGALRVRVRVRFRARVRVRARAMTCKIN